MRGTEVTPGLAVTLVHELTHVLQDQVFDLDRYHESDEEPTSGETFAFDSLVEGDADRIEQLYTDTLDPATQDAIDGREPGRLRGVPGGHRGRAGGPRQPVRRHLRAGGLVRRRARGGRRGVGGRGVRRPARHRGAGVRPLRLPRRRRPRRGRHARHRRRGDGATRATSARCRCWSCWPSGSIPAWPWPRPPGGAATPTPCSPGTGARASALDVTGDNADRDRRAGRRPRPWVAAAAPGSGRDHVADGRPRPPRVVRPGRGARRGARAARPTPSTWPSPAATWPPTPSTREPTPTPPAASGRRWSTASPTTSWRPRSRPRRWSARWPPSPPPAGDRAAAVELRRARRAAEVAGGGRLVLGRGRRGVLRRRVGRTVSPAHDHVDVPAGVDHRRRRRSRPPPPSTGGSAATTSTTTGSTATTVAGEVTVRGTVLTVFASARVLQLDPPVERLLAGRPHVRHRVPAGGRVGRRRWPTCRRGRRWR